jgi:hypothetical protein
VDSIQCDSTQLARLHLEEEILERHTQLAIGAVTEVAVARAEHTGRLPG